MGSSPHGSGSEAENAGQELMGSGRVARGRVGSGQCGVPVPLEGLRSLSPGGVSISGRVACVSGPGDTSACTPTSSHPHLLPASRASAVAVGPWHVAGQTQRGRESRTCAGFLRVSTKQNPVHNFFC